jgi:hypothetical protein
MISPHEGWNYGSVLPIATKSDAKGNITDIAPSIVGWLQGLKGLMDPQPLSDSSDPAALASGGKWNADKTISAGLIALGLGGAKAGVPEKSQPLSFEDAQPYEPSRVEQYRMGEMPDGRSIYVRADGQPTLDHHEALQSWENHRPFEPAQEDLTPPANRDVRVASLRDLHNRMRDWQENPGSDPPYIAGWQMAHPSVRSWYESIQEEHSASHEGNAPLPPISGGHTSQDYSPRSGEMVERVPQQELGGTVTNHFDSPYGSGHLSRFSSYQILNKDNDPIARFDTTWNTRTPEELFVSGAYGSTDLAPQKGMLGTTGVRTAFGKAAIRDYPMVKEITATRISGARSGGFYGGEHGGGSDFSIKVTPSVIKRSLGNQGPSEDAMYLHNLLKGLYGEEPIADPFYNQLMESYLKKGSIDAQ